MPAASKRCTCGRETLRVQGWPCRLYGLLIVLLLIVLLLQAMPRWSPPTELVVEAGCELGRWSLLMRR